MRTILLLTLIMLSPVAIAGDAEIIQVSPGVYMAIVKNHAGIFGNQSTTKKKAIAAANEFAEKQGMQATPVALEYRGAGGPGHWPAAEYQFRLVPMGNRDSISLDPRADMVVEIKSPPNAAPTQSPPDTYTDLLKLDDLRKRGIITEHEFDEQKARILSR